MNSKSQDGLRPQFAAIVLTWNEERDLPACLESIRGVASEIYVVDSGSTDATRNIAYEAGATVLSHPFTTHAEQFNWALDSIQTNAEWIIRIDADERFTPELANRLPRLASTLPKEVAGIVLSRRILFMGKNIRFGDTYPVWILRVWRNGAGRSTERSMDEYIELLHGRSVRCKGDLLHSIPKNLTDWVTKHNDYASRECVDILGEIANNSVDGNSSALRKAIKQSFYLRLPPFFRALAYWFYRYFLKLGFLDGRAGLIYHFIQGLWYRFLVDAKLYEQIAISSRRRS